jgi:uncharacterized Zn finger protein
MSEPALWLDGNAIAGLLHECFGAELTDAPRRCQSCGEVRAIGAHRLYRGAGLVLRCRVCGDVAARIGVLPDRQIVQLNGSWRLEIRS